jgi:hypothetical protein
MRVPVMNATVFPKIFDQTAGSAARPSDLARLMRTNGPSVTRTRKNSLNKAAPALKLEAWLNHAPVTFRHPIP